MSTKQLFLAIIICLIFFQTNTTFGQIYPITNGATTTVCTGTFTDSGGTVADYAANETIVHTFCPDQPGDCLWFDFSSFNTEFDNTPIFGGPVDYLNVYDGNSTAATLIQTLSGDYGAFTIPTASSSGCVTFEFISDATVQFPGWEAVISCVPCPIPQNVTQQNCDGAIRVCEERYFQPNSYSGVGYPINEINTGFSCLDIGEVNSVWYTFSVQTAGDLSFLLYPVNPDDDYDWSIYDLSNPLDDCFDIFPNNGQSPEISCNYSNSTTILGQTINNGITGAFGGAPYNGMGNSQPSTGSPYNASIPVQAGDQFVLHISNFSASQSGYFLDFSGSSAQLFDNVPPSIVSMDTIMCQDLEVFINLNEPVDCASIDPTDIIIMGPQGLNNVATAVGVNCGPDNKSDKIKVTVFPRITYSGLYTVTLVGDLLDQCGNLGTGSSFSVYHELFPVDAGPDLTICNSGPPSGNIGGAPTTLGVGDSILYVWTSNPPVATNYLSSTDVANPTFPNPATIPVGIYEYYVEVLLVDSMFSTPGLCRGFDTVQVTVQFCQGCNLNSSISGTNVICTGASNGSATATGIGGTIPYTYNWSNNQNTASINNIPSGTYIVTITDSGGCSSTNSVIIVDGNSPDITAINATTANCGISNASATATITGGSGPLSYAWENSSNPGTIISTTNPATGLAVGVYSFTVTDSDGCEDISTVNVSGSGGITLQVSPTAIQTSCVGSTDIDINLTVAGGVQPFTYNWSGPGGPYFTEDLTGIGAGTYIVSVTDDVGCVEVSSITINSPLPVLVTGVPTNAGCAGNDGYINTIVIGGSSPYTYNWGGGQLTPNISMLNAGTYDLSVTDSNGCVETNSFTITAAPGVTLQSNSQNTNCAAGADGTATVTVNTGTSPYAYIWSNGDMTQTISGLTANTYSVTVTDASGCSQTASVVVTSPAPINSTSSTTIASCIADNGTATVNPTGGSLPFTYNWSTTPPQVTQTATGLAAGPYMVSITDNNGCMITVSVNIPSAPPVTATISATMTTCAATNGTATVNPVGGTQPFNYVWNTTPPQVTPTAINLGVGSYTVTVTDINGCTVIQTVAVSGGGSISATVSSTPVTCAIGNDGTATATPAGGANPYNYIWSNNQNTQTAINLTAGTYTLTINDANGCSTTTSVTIGLTGSLTAQSSVTNASCIGNDGTATVVMNQGTGPFSYSWNTTPPQTTATAINLTPGAYSYVVTAANGCIATGTLTIGAAPAITVTTQGTNGNCSVNSASASAIASGGTPPFSYLWSNNATMQTIGGLATGTYSVTVADAAGCTAIQTVAVTSNANGPALSASHTNISCYGSNDGTIDITVNNGTPPFTYNWGNGITSEDRLGLPAGAYTVLVEDSNGCLAATTVIVAEPDSMVLTLFSTPSNGNNGTAAVNVNGGVPPFTYQWSNGQTTQVANGLAAGTYIVDIVDANGCTAQTAVTVNMNTNTETIESLTGFTIYPNPNNGLFTVELAFSKAESIEMSVFNSLGQQLQLYRENGSNILVPVDIHSYAIGVYTIRVSVDSEQMTKQFIKIE